MHVLVGRLGGYLRFFEGGALGLDQLHLGGRERGLDALARSGDFFAGLGSGGAQQFLGIGNDDLQIGDEFVFAGIGGHGLGAHDVT